MVETYGYALINSGQEQTALFLKISATNSEKCGLSVLMGLIYMKNARFTEAVREFEKAAGMQSAGHRE